MKWHDPVIGYHNNLIKEIMIRWIVAFFILALISGIFAFSGIVTGISSSIAELIFLTGLSLFVLSLMLKKNNYHRR